MFNGALDVYPIRIATFVCFNSKDKLSTHYSPSLSDSKTPIKSIESTLKGEPSIIPFL